MMTLLIAAVTGLCGLVLGYRCACVDETRRLTDRALHAQPISTQGTMWPDVE